MKYLIVAIALSIVVGLVPDASAADSDAAKSHNLIVGTKTDSYWHHVDTLKKSHSWWFGPVTADYKYETKLPITYIEVLDGYTDGNGGYPYIVSGGLGEKYVALHFISTWGHGMEFTIEVRTNVPDTNQ